MKHVPNEDWDKPVHSSCQNMNSQGHGSGGWSQSLLHMQFISWSRHQCIRAASRENLSSGLATRIDSNRPAQSQNLGNGLEFRIYKLEVLYFLGSEKQRRWTDCADAQVHSLICTFVVRMWHNYVSSWRGSFILQRHNNIGSGCISNDHTTRQAFS